MKWLKKVAATPLSSIARVIDSLDASTNDRANAPSIHAVREAINNNWLTIYPIGSIYMSVNNVDPSTIFGGTWQQIKDKFLLACGDTYNNGATGGAVTHTPTGSVDSHALTVNEMPSHTHSLDASAIEPNGTIATNPEQNTGAAAGATSSVNSVGATSGLPVTGTATATGGGAGHTHGVTGVMVDTMPPYLAVNVWVRTA